jgi:KTSC domain
MEEQKTSSKLIDTYSYNDQERQLSITFKNGGQTYIYKNVPRDVIDKVFNSPGSTGSKFIKLVKRKYQGTEE